MFFVVDFDRPLDVFAFIWTNMQRSVYNFCFGPIFYIFVEITAKKLKKYLYVFSLYWLIFETITNLSPGDLFGFITDTYIFQYAFYKYHYRDRIRIVYCVSIIFVWS